MTDFTLPSSIADLFAARARLRDHYAARLREAGGTAELSFTFDGNLIGDLGEALAVELFDIRLVDRRSTVGIDGYAPDGRTVQVKATCTRRGPAFRWIETRAEHLIFFDLDLEKATGQVVFNGPEGYATSMLPKAFVGQRSLTANQIHAADRLVESDERLPMREPGWPDGLPTCSQILKRSERCGD